MVIKIIHGIYTGNDIMDEAKEFRFYLRKKYIKFKEKYDMDILVYSVGIDDINKLKVVAVVHAFDIFDPATAHQIIRGRISRMLGHLQWTDFDGLIHRAPYNPIPEYIFFEV